MKFDAKAVLILIALVFPLWTAAWASGGATLSIAPGGDGLFLLSGQGVEAVAALDVTIGYATVSPANPQISKGTLISGALMAINDRSPGSVRLGIIKPAPLGGSGRIASIRFANGTPPAKILFLKASVFGADGEPIGILTRVVNPVPKPPPTPAVGEGGGTFDPAAESSTVTGPTNGRRELTRLRAVAAPRQEEKPGTPETESLPLLIEIPETLREAVAKSMETDLRFPQIADSGRFPFSNILERFRLFRQEKTPGSLLALFDAVESASDTIYQQPAIALADGQQRVKIIFELPRGGEGLSSFALLGARLVSSKSQGEKAWVVEVRPQALTHEASISFLYNGAIMRFNLTVAPDFNPDLDGSGGVNETDFALYLQQHGTEQSPKFDLNGDGMRNYIDDYIYTTNYILKRQRERF